MILQSHDSMDKQHSSFFLVFFFTPVSELLKTRPVLLNAVTASVEQLHFVINVNFPLALLYWEQ